MACSHQQQLLAQKLEEQPQNIAPSILSFLEHTQNGAAINGGIVEAVNDKLKKIVSETAICGLYADKPITGQEVEAYFILFLRGLNYSYQQHGVTVGRINIIRNFVEDDKKNKVFDLVGYSAEGDTLTFTAEMLCRRVLHCRSEEKRWTTLSVKLAGINTIFTAQEVAIIIGAEEGDHAREQKKYPKKCPKGVSLKKLAMEGYSNVDAYYRQDGVEKAFAARRQKVIDRFGLGKGKQHSGA